ncbi:MAG: helix-turn-helix transcriptional regulator [Myxococcota bacterium]
MTPDEFVIETGRRIRELRTRRGLSQAELARRSKLSIVSLNRIECARQEPSLRSLVMIAEVLEVQPFELFPSESTGDPRDAVLDAFLRLLPPTDPDTQLRLRRALLALVTTG